MRAIAERFLHWQESGPRWQVYFSYAGFMALGFGVAEIIQWVV